MIPPALTQTLRQLGLPTPRSLQPLGTHNGFDDTAILFGDTLSDQFIVLRRAVDGWGELRLEREIAAFSAMEDADIPIPIGYRILRNLPSPTALFPPVQGTAGAEVLRARTDLVHIVFTAMGHAMRRIHGVALPKGGHGAIRKGFIPTAKTPGEEWLQEARQNHWLAQTKGVDLGRIGRDLLHAVEAAIDAINAVKNITLVHRNMGPDMIWLTPKPDGPVELTGVLNWGNGIAGAARGGWAPGSRRSSWPTATR